MHSILIFSCRLISENIDGTFKIKKETQHLHRKIDQHPQLSRLMSNTLLLSDYRITLELLYQWHKSVESIIYSKDLTNLGLRMLPKHPMILRDLQNINKYKPQTWQQPPIHTDSLAEVLGLVYVVEGATMGGQMLGPKIAKTLKRQDITHYYSIYQSDTKEYFYHNMTVLNDQVTSPGEQALCVEGAKKGFLLLDGLLQNLNSIGAA